MPSGQKWSETTREKRERARTTDEGGHVDIITGHEIAVIFRSDEVFLVMEYAPHEVNNFMEATKCLESNTLNALMIQPLNAVQYYTAAVCNAKISKRLTFYKQMMILWSRTISIRQRNLKPSNILLTEDGILKVADFGWARDFDMGISNQQYTPVVVTRWYRAPELLLHSKTYGTPIDMWSVGCIFAELINLQPLFPGTSEINQLKIMYEVLGTPSDTVWPGYSALPLVNNIIFDEYTQQNIRHSYTHVECWVYILGTSELD
ncbi:hypothetical protein SFRURICE_011419 [Spodoptera frugiperda]|nr:hypothetical protein SFRURICE_011419 [Spodoptera frugiperda]